MDDPIYDNVYMFTFGKFGFLMGKLKPMIHYKPNDYLAKYQIPAIEVWTQEFWRFYVLYNIRLKKSS